MLTKLLSLIQYAFEHVEAVSLGAAGLFIAAFAVVGVLAAFGWALWLMWREIVESPNTEATLDATHHQAPRASAAAVVPVQARPVHVLTCEGRTVTLTCGHRFTEGAAHPMPAIGAVAHCPMCARPRGEVSTCA